jgi:hypothetical protein
MEVTRIAGLKANALTYEFRYQTPHDLTGGSGVTSSNAFTRREQRHHRVQSEVIVKL